MPQMGFDMKQGTVVRWIKGEGEEVARGEAIAEIETDKAVVEIEAFGDGVLRKIVVAEGETVEVGTIIGLIAKTSEDVPESFGVAAEPKIEGIPKIETDAPAIMTDDLPPKHFAAPPTRVKASPLARKEATEHGLDVASVPGTGPGGRVTKNDVLRFVSQLPAEVPAEADSSPAPASVATGRVVPLSRMRQAIARNMSHSKQEIPHFYVTVEIDMDEAVRLRMQLNETLDKNVRVSVNDMVIKAVAQALPQHPMFNASFVSGGIEFRGDINVGMAIALEEGLIAPAIMGCSRKRLIEIAEETTTLADRARSGVLSAEEYTSATFNVTNLGMYGVEEFSAIITPPQSAALAVGSVREVPVVKGVDVAVGQRMKVTLSIDHRVADGSQAALFLSDIRQTLENPIRLLM